MSRFVVPSRPGLAAASGPEPSDAIERIVKYVPAEIVSVFMIVVSALVAAKAGMSEQTAQVVAAGLIVLFFVGTIVYMAVRAPAGTVRRAQMFVSPVAFIAWAYPISSALLATWFVGWIAVVLQAVALLLAVIIAPSDPA